MKQTACSVPRWLTALCALTATSALWIAAIATEAAARIAYQLYVRLGSELPALSAMLISAVKSHVPLVVAMAGTLMLAWLAVRANSRVLQGCVLAAVIAALMASLTVLAFALPLSLCGNVWPDWVTEAGDVVQATGKSNPAVSCR